MQLYFSTKYLEFFFIVESFEPDEPKNVEVLPCRNSTRWMNFYIFNNVRIFLFFMLKIKICS